MNVEHTPNKHIKKGPKGPHIVHLSTMCHLCWRICQDNWVLASFQVSSNSLQQFQRKSWKCQGGQPQSWFSNRPKNTNLVEYVEIFLPVKFRWIMLSSCREEVENFSAKLKARTAILVFRISRSSWFSDQPKENPKKLGTRNWVTVTVLASCQFCHIPFSGFRGEVSSLCKSEARTAIFVFVGRRCWVLAFCQVLLNSVLM